MTPELLSVLILCVLAPIHAVMSGTSVALFMGFKWGLGNRVSEPEIPHWVIRMKRAHKNLMENIPSFIGLVLLAHVLDVGNDITIWASCIFTASRILYAFVYILGITFLYMRTILYFISISTMFLIAWQILRLTM